MMAAAAAFVGSATFAYADGMMSKVSYKDAPAPACAAHAFAGRSLGVFIGYADASTDVTDVDYYWGGDTQVIEDGGFIGGVQVGYDWARCNTLFGVVADLSFLNADTDESYDYGYWKTQSDIEWMSTLRLRAGAVLDNTLFYLTGGIAFAGIDNQAHYYNYESWKDDDTRVGYVIGAGLEHMLKPRTFLTVEALYADFGDETVKDDYYREYKVKFDNDVFIGKIGLNFRFGHDHLEPLK